MFVYPLLYSVSFHHSKYTTWIRIFVYFLFIWLESLFLCVCDSNMASRIIELWGKMVKQKQSQKAKADSKSSHVPQTSISKPEPTIHRKKAGNTVTSLLAAHVLSTFKPKPKRRKEVCQK